MTNVNEMPAGREMDALVAEKVMGWSLPGDGFWHDADGSLVRLDHYESDIWDEAWSPSDDIADAWQVIEKMLSIGWSYGLTDGAQPQPLHDCWFFKETEEQPHFSAISTTAPLSICRAALKAAEKQ